MSVIGDCAAIAGSSRVSSYLLVLYIWTVFSAVAFADATNFTAVDGSISMTLPTLSFAITGNTRPRTQDDVSGYPSSIITQIWQDIEAQNPAFAVTTGAYMFASPTATPNTAATQMDLYMQARSNFTNPVFYAMGDQECNELTSYNCAVCAGGVCPTPNLAAFMNSMMEPLNQSLPYYTISIGSTTGAWTAKIIMVACNAWSSTQATWLNSQLSIVTTYTFVVSNAPTTTTSAACMSGSGNVASIVNQHPLTLFIGGHIGTYSYSRLQKLVIVGNGGAPLSTGVDYGYVIATQLASGHMQFSSYDYATNAVVSSFTL